MCWAPTGSPPPRSQSGLARQLQSVQAVADRRLDGYRMIDTAAAYCNKREEGEKICTSGSDHDCRHQISHQ
jgi:diketogulonate reductase-like aldo/keto reductase